MWFSGRLLWVPLAFLPAFVLAADLNRRISSCAIEQDPLSRAKACTDVIESGRPRVIDLLWAHNNRAVSQAQLNNIPAALQDLAAALALDPGFPPAYYTRGEIYRRLGTYEQAVQDFDQALEVIEKMGKRSETVYNWTDRGKMITGVDVRLPVLLSRSTVLVELKRLNEAVDDCYAAQGIAPNDPRPYKNLGYIHLLRQDYPTSIRFYEKALALAPDDQQIQAGLKAARDAVELE
jgi:tetratricopeptide (TPR) repeat protein